ncbi:cationic amino acid transporter 2, vacuolar-like isoform X1 [Actinidia eriantha]|uniref:cationic amino acid transporter 2, vacuolar-like isoform X1 n=1 Tax=Actinidia eriantha TaxID=165200 RepID=UPI00258525C8|nr:cationic amino acid transporter 2, vacuolar-like isoform X1 [Actinidia eriantha]
MARGGGWFESLIRRKRVDSGRTRPQAQQLAKKLSAFDLVAIGVGSTIGAGIYILVGTVAREQTGPGIIISFLIGGIAAALSAFCYAELACRCPAAGSAYHYTYICVGEGVAWLIGWALILEYTLGSAAVARGMLPNLALLFGGADKLPAFLTRQIFFGIVVDPCAAIFVCIVASLLCLGIKESSLAQTIVTTVNVAAMFFIIIAGVYIGFKTGWVGYELPNGYFPFGVNGIFAGSATLFYSYVGFDSVSSTAEEVKNPQRDLPFGIGIALSLCCILYILVSAVIVGLVPYYALDPDTPVSSAFASYGMEWAVYVITIGAVTALCSGLIGGILPQPRILTAMARDGLLPSFFSDINKHTKVPIKSTVVTGVSAAALAFFMDIEQLAGMVSVGTLLAFTAVAISILILRYVPPDDMPFPSSLQNSIHPVSVLGNRNVQDSHSGNTQDTFCSCDHFVGHPLVDKEVVPVNFAARDNELKRRKIASWSITFVCTGALVLASAASAKDLPGIPRFVLCGLGGVFLLSGLTVLSSIDQDEASRSFGQPGGFICPFVPLLPVCCILINTYLLVNLGGDTWIRASIWLVAGALIYIFYGRSHSLLLDTIYVPIAHADEITSRQ